jgi:hypothetical protein
MEDDRKDSDTGFSCRCIIIYFSMKQGLLHLMYARINIILGARLSYIKLRLEPSATALMFTQYEKKSPTPTKKKRFLAVT